MSKWKYGITFRYFINVPEDYTHTGNSNNLIHIDMF